MLEVVINLPLAPHEVPLLRESIGWEGRHSDYPLLLERCNFWAGVRDDKNELIAFGYVAGMGLQHGYMEDIMVRPQYQRQGIGQALVRKLLQQADQFGLEMVTLTYAAQHAGFYTDSGFTHCPGGIWRRS